MAATISTPTSYMAWAMRMAESMTAMLDSPTGNRDGPTPRRTGAARTRRKDASSTTVTAMLVLGRPPSVSGVAQTSRSAVLTPLCLRTSVMQSVSSRESLPSASAESTGLAIMSSVARRMAASWPTARCKWSVTFAEPARFRKLAVKFMLLPKIPLTAMPP